MARPPIRTPDQKLRVFVSSTLGELAPEREACKSAIERIRLTPVMFELGARPHPPRHLYREYLSQSDVFIGIYWQRYGWIAPGQDISGLEDEYRLAGRLPKLLYIKRADAREERLTQLIARIEADDQASYRLFGDAAELKDLVENDLAILLTERFTAVSPSQYEETPEAIAEPRRLGLPPVERGGLIGRAHEIEAVAALLRRADVGLVTLTGPGGTGKTRLAVHLANSLAPNFRDGVCFVALATIREAAEVVPAISTALEIPPPSTGASPENLLTGFLRGRQLLLVLDNFEQVLAAAPAVGELLATCAELKVLCTSRQPLRLRGEREVPVPPLPHMPASAGEITPAMALFEERAREVRPQFGIDSTNYSAVMELCRRVDALPLAIELAAARARVLSPQAIVDRLQQTIDLLTSDRRDSPARHQTLRSTIEWSLDLLSPAERDFFERLGVFAGGFSEEAAAAVTADTGIEALDGLTSLVEKSLLVRTEAGEEAGFHMLETVRELALERLVASGHERAVRVRHVEWLIAFHAWAFHALMNPQNRAAIRDRMALEENAARLALRFAAGPEGDAELAWQLFIEYGATQGLHNARTAEVFASYELVAALPRSSDPVRAALATGIWAWARAVTFNPGAIPDFETTCAFLEEAGERRLLPAIATAWGMLLASVDSPRTQSVLERALALARESSLVAIEDWTLQTLCYAKVHDGDLEAAERYAHELAESASRGNDDMRLTYSLTMRARVQLAREDLDGARDLYFQAVQRTRAGGDAWPRFLALCGLASVLLEERDEIGARSIVAETLRFFRAVGYLGVDVLCGSQSLFLFRAGERDRALKVFTAVSPGAEDAAGYGPDVTDPTGSLREATRRARELLGNPPPVDPAFVDIEAALQAAVQEVRRRNR